MGDPTCLACIRCSFGAAPAAGAKPKGRGACERVVLLASMEFSPFVLWLASFPDRLKHDTRKLSLSNAFGTQDVSKSLEEPTPLPVEPNRAHGWIEVSVGQRFTQMAILDPYERDQVRQWALLLGRPDPLSLSQELVFFNVHKRQRFEERPQTMFWDGGAVGGHNKGSLVQLQDEFQAKLASLVLPPGPPSQPWCCVRLPAEWAALVSAGRWHSFCLPDIRCETSAFNLRWTLIGMLPLPPVVLEWKGEVDLRQNIQQESNIETKSRSRTSKQNNGVEHRNEISESVETKTTLKTNTNKQ